MYNETFEYSQVQNELYIKKNNCINAILIELAILLLGLHFFLRIKKEIDVKTIESVFLINYVVSRILVLT